MGGRRAQTSDCTGDYVGLDTNNSLSDAQCCRGIRRRIPTSQRSRPIVHIPETPDHSRNDEAKSGGAGRLRACPIKHDGMGPHVTLFAVKP